MKLHTYSLVLLSIVLLTACTADNSNADDLVTYCVGDATEVYSCGDTIKTVHGLLGGGTSWFKDDVEIRCPVVGPDSMSEECKELMENPPDCELAFTCSPPVEPPRACCKALTAECLACADGVSVDDYCAEYPETIGCQEQISEGVVACDDPRPEICTMIYDPVCAMVDTGIRCIKAPCPSAEWKTYGSSCTACSDENVIGYVSGECPAA